MDFKELINNNLKLNTSKIHFDEPMKKHTSFKIGGSAECLIIVENQDELIQILQFANKNQIPLTVIGNGSNLLVLDGGIKGITLKINIKKLEINKKEDYIEITVGAGNNNIEFAQKLLKEEIAGFEEISGIPGTIGGAIRMNAGAYGKEMKDIIKDVTFMDYEGNITKLKNEELKFEYRNSMFSCNKYIILQATLKLQSGTKEEIKQKMAEYMKSRKEKQPLDYPSAGSTFKRGDGFITAKLIDECGLKGYNIGGAEVSTKHAGFVLNKGKATAKDVIELTNYVKEKVFEKFQKEIELEIEIIGEDEK